MKWVLYYGDRTTFTNEDGEWADAPFLNVAALAIPEPSVKRQIITGDYYILWSEANQTPHSPEFAGLLDYLVSIEAITSIAPLAYVSLDDLRDAGVKLGRMYDNDDWRELWDWIVADADETWGHTA